MSKKNENLEICLMKRRVVRKQKLNAALALNVVKSTSLWKKNSKTIRNLFELSTVRSI